MARKISMLAPDWWDFTTLPDELLEDAARLSPKELFNLSREGFKIVFYDTLEDFYLAEAILRARQHRQFTELLTPAGPAPK